MNTSGEVADLMVKEGIQITESATKLAALGAKNLAAIIIAMLNEDTKLQGKTNLRQLLKSEKPLCILQIKENDLKKFNDEAKKYGVLFTAVSDKTNNTGFCDIIAKQDDVTKLNYIMERLGYTAPEIEPEPEPKEKTSEDKSKNQSPRAKENQQESEFMKHGDMEKTDNDFNGKPSVRKKIEDIKNQQKKQKSEIVPEKEQQPVINPAPKKKKKHKHKKGKSR